VRLAGGTVEINSPNLIFNPVSASWIGVLPNYTSQNHHLLCLGQGGVIGRCSPSLSSLRYKTKVASFSAGLDLIRQMRPVTFDWKDTGNHDLGLIAEEVAAIEPLLAVRDEKGEIQGVQYNHINVLLINAVKEQQTQLETMQQQNTSLKQQNSSQQQLLNALQKRLETVERVLVRKVGKRR
jgi:hypothetical protein